jgi:hypothetical protein
MAKTVDAAGLAAARQIMLLLRRNPSIRESVAAQESGEQPILVASIDDPLTEVIERINAVGLPVTLCVTAGSASMTVLTVRAGIAGEEAGWEPVPPNATIGVVVSRFWMKSSATFRVPDPTADLELNLQLA